jgi:hypothetical protein
MIFKKPYSQYSGKWYKRTDVEEDIVYYIVSGYEAKGHISDWPRPWRMVVLTKGQDYYSSKMTVHISQKDLRKYNPETNDKARVLKTIFGEGWRSG